MHGRAAPSRGLAVPTRCFALRFWPTRHPRPAPSLPRAFRSYLAHGTATDFMWQELHVPVPMTWEVYGDSRASFEDCFRMFNPLTRQAYDATVESWTAAVFTLLTLLPGHPEIAPELEAGSGAGSARQQPQQEEEGQQQQHGDSSISRTAAAAAPREAAVDGGGANASAGKAAEIASALKQHMQQEQQQAQASATEQQGATEAAAAAEGVQRMLGVRRGTVWQQRSVRTAQALTWLAVAGTGACVGDRCVSMMMKGCGGQRAGCLALAAARPGCAHLAWPASVRRQLASFFHQRRSQLPVPL